MNPFIIGFVCLVLILVATALWLKFQYKLIKWQNVLIASIVSVVLVLITGELFIGNTWYRNVGEMGNKQVIFSGMLKVIFEPLNPNAIWLWSPEWWITNVFVIFDVVFLSLTYIPKLTTNG